MEAQKVLGKLEVFLENEYDTTIKELMVDGASHYYSMCGYIEQDYITKSDIREDIEGCQSVYGEYDQQSVVLDKLEEFVEKAGIEWEDLNKALKIIESEVKEYLLNSVDGIAYNANEDREDD